MHDALSKIIKFGSKYSMLESQECSAPHWYYYCISQLDPSHHQHRQPPSVGHSFDIKTRCTTVVRRPKEGRDCVAPTTTCSGACGDPKAVGCWLMESGGGTPPTDPGACEDARAVMSCAMETRHQCIACKACVRPSPSLSCAARILRRQNAEGLGMMHVYPSCRQIEICFFCRFAPWKMTRMFNW